MHDNVELLPDRKLSFQLEIDDENATRKLITESIRLASSTMGDFIPGPKFKLEVLDAQRHLTDVVNVGDSGYILITLQQQHSTPKKDAIFLMTDLSARNIKTNQMIPLIDSDGSVSFI
ncbi:unnamed protein product [Anisakis simplex]|uniref:Cadherin domain-containing protein n=1 Tax=Anisakis simplex TaxID=6269 RepID=A0A0M3JI77_ANISI|nr:unnamed protein product [Anisakis simplex]